MEPITVAASVVVGMLARYAEHLAGAAGKAADEALTERLRLLWRAVKARFQSDPGALDSLARLRKKPESGHWRAAVEEHLDEAMTADRSFATLVANLAKQIQGVDISNVDIRDAGAVAIGGDVSVSGTYAAGRDLTVDSARTDAAHRED